MPRNGPGGFDPGSAGHTPSTFENWQSEFLQLIWQAAGLALFLFWGSSQSKESDERLEAKVDALLRERGIDAREISATVNRSLS